jgi:hypothetical protein
VYVIAQPHIGILTDETWYLNDFLDNGLEAFMEGYVHGRRDIYSNT